MNYESSWTVPGQGFIKEAKGNIILMDLSPRHYKALMKELPRLEKKLGRNAKVMQDAVDSIFIGDVDDTNKAKKEVLNVFKKLNIRVPNDVDMRVQ
jgi:hypothetical protein